MPTRQNRLLVAADVRRLIFFYANALYEVNGASLRRLLHGVLSIGFGLSAADNCMRFAIVFSWIQNLSN